MPDSGNGETNQRVTMAVLQRDVQALADELRKWREEDRSDRREIEKRLRDVEINARGVSSAVADNCREIENLRAANMKWDGVNSLLSVIAMVLGGLGIGINR